MQKKFFMRLLISVILGIIFGLICVKFASGTNSDIWGTALMWNILFNRFLIGMIVAIVGIFTVHPIFGFRVYVIRGLIFGAIISLQLAIGVFINSTMDSTQQVKLFWYTIIAGAIYGLIIDIIATKFGGEGKELLHKNNK